VQAVYNAKIHLGVPRPCRWYGASPPPPPPLAAPPDVDVVEGLEGAARSQGDKPREGGAGGRSIGQEAGGGGEHVASAADGRGLEGLEREREMEQLRAERDKWVDFAGRLRGLLGLGEGRGGGAGLLNVVKKELDARDQKITSLSERLVWLETDAKQREHAGSAARDSRNIVADKIAALEHNTQRSVWDERTGAARRKKTFAQRFCENPKSKRAASVPPLIANMIENSNRRPYARDSYDGGGGGGGLSSLGGVDEIVLPRIGRNSNQSSGVSGHARGGWRSSLA
jgi:hypothetical protein